MTASRHTGKPTRVLWISSQLDPPSSVRPYLELARGLARKGLEIHVMARVDSHAAQAAREAGFPVVEFPPRGLFGRFGRWAVRKVCLDREIGLVHLFDAVAMAAVVPSLRDLSVPVVAHHGRTGGVQRWNPIAHLTVLQQRIDRVICTSETAHAELAKRRDPASVITIPPGLDAGWYDAEPFNLARFSVPPGAFAIGVVADYHARLGIEYIVDSAQWLPLDGQAYFLLVGSGHENRFVLERIHRSPLRECFRLVGPRLDAPRITAACSVSVRAALGGDGLSQAVMESMACGVPPVITDAGAGGELVRQGECGIVVRQRSPRALGEALAWLKENPARRIAMGHAARERIRRELPLDRTIEAHFALYRSLLGQVPASSHTCL
jgi:L-malate glycosyltransferase